MANAPEAAPSLQLATLCIDCADADAMADFYGRLLGWEVTLRTPGWVLMRDPAGLMFCVVPDPPGTLNEGNARRWE